MTEWRKAIPEERDRRQSQAIAWGVGVVLALAAAAPLLAAWKLRLPRWPLTMPIVFSAGFAVLAWRFRAATAAGAAMGGLVCFLLAQSPDFWARYVPLPSPHAPLWALVAVVVLTFAATKFGRAKKEARGLAEERRGRRASQVAANLGVAAIFAAAGGFGGAVAALAEATADTVSSEIGQAVGGQAVLLTTRRPVTAGTDGGVSLAGTVAGVLGAAVIVGIGGWHHAWPEKTAVMIAACAGLFFDSLLGATAERRGWIGNDVVNLASTLFSALLAEALVRR